VDVSAAEPLSTPLPRPATETGRGGQQHRYLQTLIKGWGEERGFRVSLEVPVLSGTGNVDVVLERGDLTLACEISVTTPTGHEVGNLQKCLAAGYNRVLLVSPTARNLARVRKRAAEVFSKEELARLDFLLPEAIPGVLDQMGLPAPTSETLHGYKVNVQYVSPEGGTEGDKLDAIRQVIGRAFKKKRE
jgi:hypothetical protein